MNQLPVLGYKAIAPVVTFLLLTASTIGLESRPSNLTCLAENITPRVIVSDAFPGTTFLRPIALRQNSSDSSRIFVALKGGRIELMIHGTKQSQPFLDISSRVSTGGEQGLLGIAFHSNYQANGFFYVSYTDINGDSVISRFTRSAGNQNMADATSESVILTVTQPYANHNGGNIEFGPDGYLYIGFGDGGSGGDPLDHGQDISTWLGSMLRIDVNGAQPYLIPPDNPFAGQTCNMSSRTGTCPEIYAYGLRNPWRWSFDSSTGELWLGDVGQNQIEEIDRIDRGNNLGWRCYEGTEIFNPAGCDSLIAVPPVIQYSHTNGRCSVTGGYVYRGTSIPELQGYYLYGDYCTGEIWTYPTLGPPGTLPSLLTTGNGNIYSFAEDINGEVYVLQSNGIIGRIELDSAGGGPDLVANLLSQTGCVDETDPTRPAAGMIPYGIQAPFWSDGAQKSRWLAIPDNTLIDNSVQDWSFPRGTVLIKQFEIGGKRIETRHLKRHTNGSWAGYTYEWNDEQTDAERVRFGKTVVVNNGSTTQNWVIPSETECLVCHTAAAGYALGPELAQLNRDFFYSSTGRTANQLTTAWKIGLLTDALGDVPENLPSLADPYNTMAEIGLRARAWLHTNCAGCHRPAGSTNSAMDLRSETMLSATNSCNVTANSTGPGWPAVILTPGNAITSLLYYRANSRHLDEQMPPIGSTLVDDEGMEVLKIWIDSLSNCSP